MTRYLLSSKVTTSISEINKDCLTQLILNTYEYTINYQVSLSVIGESNSCQWCSSTVDHLLTKSFNSWSNFWANDRPIFNQLVASTKSTINLALVKGDFEATQVNGALMSKSLLPPMVSLKASFFTFSDCKSSKERVCNSRSNSKCLQSSSRFTCSYYQSITVIIAVPLEYPNREVIHYSSFSDCQYSQTECWRMHKKNLKDNICTAGSSCNQKSISIHIF